MGTDPRLDTTQLTVGRDAAFANAKQLVSEAELLLEHGHPARALFLVQIAGEEIGKGFLLAGCALRSIAGSINWRKFWKSIRSHSHKMEAVMLTESVCSPSLADHERSAELDSLKERARALEQGKQWSLYVDFTDGHFHTPELCIPATMAHNAVEWAKGRLAMLAHFEKLYAIKPADSWTKDELIQLESMSPELAAKYPLIDKP